MNDYEEFIRREREERIRLKRDFPDLYSAVLDILYRHDPIGICFDVNPHASIEYEPETGTILPRLHSAKSSVDVHTIVYEEFVRWFDRSARDKNRYYDAAMEIWDLISKPGDFHDETESP